MLSFRNTTQTSKNVPDTNFQHKEIINLEENETDFQKDKFIVDTFNKYFCNIVKKLYIPKDTCFEDQTSNLGADRVKHPSKNMKIIQV